MLNAKEAARKVESPPIEVSKDVEKKLNDMVLRAIDEWKNFVKEVLIVDKGLERKVVPVYLEKMWYQNVGVSSIDWHNEKVFHIKFNF